MPAFHLPHDLLVATLVQAQKSALRAISLFGAAGSTGGVSLLIGNSRLPPLLSCCCGAELQWLL